MVSSIIMLDVIKEFYSQKTSTVGGATGYVATPLVDMELRSIRAALFDALKLYVKEDVKHVQWTSFE